MKFVKAHILNKRSLYNKPLKELKSCMASRPGDGWFKGLITSRNLMVCVSCVFADPGSGSGDGDGECLSFTGLFKDFISCFTSAAGESQTQINYSRVVICPAQTLTACIVSRLWYEETNHWGQNVAERPLHADPFILPLWVLLCLCSPSLNVNSSNKGFIKSSLKNTMVLSVLWESSLKPHCCQIWQQRHFATICEHGPQCLLFNLAAGGVLIGGGCSRGSTSTIRCHLHVGGASEQQEMEELIHGGLEKVRKTNGSSLNMFTPVNLFPNSKSWLHVTCRIKLTKTHI